MTSGNLIMCPTVVQKLDTTSLTQHDWQHWKKLKVPTHTIPSDRQFSLSFLTISVWFEGVGHMMLNIIFHLKLLLTTNIFHCFWKTKCFKPEVRDHADLPPCGSWLPSPCYSLQLWCLGQALTLSFPIKFVLHGRRDTSQCQFCAIYAGTMWPY